MLFVLKFLFKYLKALQNGCGMSIDARVCSMIEGLTPDFDFSVPRRRFRGLPQ